MIILFILFFYFKFFLFIFKEKKWKIEKTFKKRQAPHTKFSKTTSSTHKVLKNDKLRTQSFHKPPVPHKIFKKQQAPHTKF